MNIIVDNFITVITVIAIVLIIAIMIFIIVIIILIINRIIIVIIIKTSACFFISLLYSLYIYLFGQHSILKYLEKDVEFWRVICSSSFARCP